MLTIRGRQQGVFCDGLSRCGFLRIGRLGLGRGFGGLSLAGCLAANANATSGKTPHSVIMVYLPGGLTQSDTFDMKPAAPREVRGPFQPMSTRISGLTICELMPRVAQAMHRVALVRTIVGFQDPVHINDLNATILHNLGIDHQRFSVKYQGLDVRLTGVEGARVVKGLLA